MDDVDVDAIMTLGHVASQVLHQDLTALMNSFQMCIH